MFCYSTLRPKFTKITMKISGIVRLIVWLLETIDLRYDETTGSIESVHLCIYKIKPFEWMFRAVFDTVESMTEILTCCVDAHLTKVRTR